ncbi:MAG: hypothetical protein Tsb009_28400 [Planctomycetaceae bacterium]
MVGAIHLLRDESSTFRITKFDADAQQSKPKAVYARGAQGGEIIFRKCVESSDFQKISTEIV